MSELTLKQKLAARETVQSATVVIHRLQHELEALHLRYEALLEALRWIEFDDPESEAALDARTALAADEQ